MSTVDTEEAGTAAPFTAQGWLECLRSKSSSDAGSGGHDAWVCCCGRDFADGSTLDTALVREQERSKEHQRSVAALQGRTYRSTSTCHVELYVFRVSCFGMVSMARTAWT